MNFAGNFFSFLQSGRSASWKLPLRHNQTKIVLKKKHHQAVRLGKILLFSTGWCSYWHESGEFFCKIQLETCWIWKKLRKEAQCAFRMRIRYIISPPQSKTQRQLHLWNCLRFVYSLLFSLVFGNTPHIHSFDNISAYFFVLRITFMSCNQPIIMPFIYFTSILSYQKTIYFSHISLLHVRLHTFQLIYLFLCKNYIDLKMYNYLQYIWAVSRHVQAYHLRIPYLFALS